MMKQQTDKFFRDKLGQHQLTPPPSAWDRIDAGLSKKNRPVAFWLKIAASFLIVATAAYVLWPGEKKNDPAIANESNTPIQNDSTKKQKDISLPTIAPESSEKRVAENKPKEAKEKKSNLTSSKKESADKVEEKIQNPSANQTPVVEEERAPQVIDNAPEVIQPNAIAKVEEEKVAPNEKSIKITINASESEKFLDKNSLAQATPGEKKTSTLKKLLDKAEDMDPFGDLRQKKNEILALNFKSEKNQRGQNK
jgi:hypothetical protein